MTAVEVPTSGAQFIRPTKATAPPSSVILGAFANRNTHYKSGPGSNGRERKNWRRREGGEGGEGGGAGGATDGTGARHTFEI
jgi:hypothetical protein